jgi:hypothetical protein
MSFAGFGALYAGREEEAVVWANRSIDLKPNHAVAYLLLAAALARLGRVEEARDAATAALQFSPGYTIARDRSMWIGDNPVHLAARERLYEAWRMAGVPEE